MLSGGGARSLTEVVVLKTLEKHNLIPDVITGTSMGGIVGGFHAAGFKLSQMEKFAMAMVISKMLDTKSPLIYFEENELEKAEPAKYGRIRVSRSVLTRQMALDN
ncbi:MAG: patatin-like phospholipase family protein [Caldisericota bacterium]|nr:patatin-like phospholipase family protein [Caldisericota bacterium]